jgi:hypothetical protein
LTSTCYFLQELDAALAAARAETQESVTAGNDNYNRLLAAKLQREAELQEELQQVRQQRWHANRECSCVHMYKLGTRTAAAVP